MFKEKGNNETKFANSILLLISIYFLPEPGGGAAAALNRATILKNIGYKVFILCGFPSYPNGKILDPKYKKKYLYVEKIQNFTIIRLKLLPLKHEGYIKRLILFLNFVIISIIFLPKILKITGKINLVYSLAPIIFSSINGAIYSIITRSLFIYDVPDLWPEELVAFNSPLTPFISFFGKPIAKWTYSLPDIIITISESAANIIYQNYKPASSIYCIPLGVNTQLFPKLSKTDSREKLITEKIFPKDLINKFIILYAGIISPAQQVQNLITLAEKIRNLKDVRIVIFGEGEDKPKIEKRIQYLDNVYLFDYQPRNVMPLIYSSVDVGMVLLSNEPIFEIAFPTKFYEYIACYKPVLAICKGELSRIINFNKIGYAVESNDIDSLVLFINNIRGSTELINNIEENVTRVLNKFSLETLSLSLKEILEKEIADKEITYTKK